MRSLLKLTRPPPLQPIPVGARLYKVNITYWTFLSNETFKFIEFEDDGIRYSIEGTILQTNGFQHYKGNGWSNLDTLSLSPNGPSLREMGYGKDLSFE